MEGKDTGWLSELEKKGLHQAAEILQNYEIGSETDVSVLDPDDLSKLVLQGSIPWMQRSCSAGVTLYVHVPTTC